MKNLNDIIIIIIYLKYKINIFIKNKGKIILIINTQIFYYKIQYSKFMLIFYIKKHIRHFKAFIFNFFFIILIMNNPFIRI